MNSQATAPPTTLSSADLDALRSFLIELLESGRGVEGIDLVIELVARLRASNNEKTQRIVALLRQQFGRSSEKLTRDQLELAFLEAEAAMASDAAPPTEPEAPPEPTVQPKPRSKPTGRRQLPKELRREVVRHEPSEADKHCDTCGQDKTCIGHESSEVLEYRPAELFVIEHQRAKFACKPCEDGVVIAPVAPKPIEGGLVGPGLLAQVVVSKYKDHLPLYRQSQIFARLGVDLADSTLGGWIAEAANLLEPIWKRLCAQVLLPKVMAVDDTPISVLDRDHKDGVKKGHLWCYVGYDRGKPMVAVFVYTPTWKGDGPRTFLAERVGYVQCDGYKGLDALFLTPAPPRCIKVGCMAHSRRKFHEAFVAKDKRAAAPLRLIQALYRVEDEARVKGLAGEKRRLLRETDSRPHIDALRQWLHDHGSRVNPKSALGKAVTYANNQWDSLVVFLHDGDIPIDNNGVENKIRPIALGRRNWLFAGNDAGAERAAILYSVMAACILAGVEPFAYLRDVFDKLSKAWPNSRLDELLPARWADARREHNMADTGGA